MLNVSTSKEIPEKYKQTGLVPRVEEHLLLGSPVRTSAEPQLLYERLGACSRVLYPEEAVAPALYGPSC